MNLRPPRLLWTLLCAALLACGGESPDPDPNNELPKAPDFTLQAADGSNVSLSDYSGNVVFINFWATWCPPCRFEMPHLQQLYEQYADQGFTILAVSLDDPFAPAAPEFAEQLGLTFPILQGTAEINAAYGGLAAIPTTVAVDRQGASARILVGEQPFETFEAVLLDLL